MEISALNAQICTEALKYVIEKYSLSKPHELEFAAQAIVHANPEDFVLKDSHDRVQKITFKLWSLKVEYFIREKQLMYNKRATVKQIAELKNEFWVEEKRIEAEFLFLVNELRQSL